MPSSAMGFPSLGGHGAIPGRPLPVAAAYRKPNGTGEGCGANNHPLFWDCRRRAWRGLFRAHEHPNPFLAADRRLRRLAPHHLVGVLTPDLAFELVRATLTDRHR